MKPSTARRCNSPAPWENFRGYTAPLRWIGIGAILFILCGCSGIQQLRNIQPPQLSVQNVRMTGISFQAVDLAFRINIRNPNRLSVNLAGFDYQLQVEGQPFLQGEQQQAVKIAALGNSEVDVPVRVGFREFYETFQQLRGQDSSAYRFECGLLFDLPLLGKKRLPVSREGYLPLLRLPSVGVASLKIEKMGLTGADLLLNLEVENSNAARLFLNHLDYNLSVNGQSWAGGETHQSAEVAAHGRSLLSIPLSLNFLQMGQTAVQLLAGKQSLNYQLSGNLNLDSSIPLLKNVSLPINRQGVVELSR